LHSLHTASDASFAAVLQTLARLHEPKDRIYRDAWRKRGELVGIFSNIARKYDRLEQALGKENPDSVESVADTIADLCVYATKYITYLAEIESAAWCKASPSPFAGDPETHRADRGHGAVISTLLALEAYEQAAQSPPPLTLAEAFDRVQRSFLTLERLLLEQAGEAHERLASAWSLADDSARLLWKFSLEEPDRYQRFVDSVRALSG
jgi:hypothetical protein